MAGTKSKIEIERCVICRSSTDYTKNQSIHERKYYVECAGQLCAKCYKKLY